MDSVLTTIYFCCMGVGLLLPLAHVVLDFLDLDFDAGDADAPLPFNIMALSFGVLVFGACGADPVCHPAPETESAPSAQYPGAGLEGRGHPAGGPL